MSRINQLAVGLLSLLSLFSVPAFASDYYDVTDVKPSDTLNMRDVQPGVDKATNAKIVGEIPHDAKDLQATGRTLEVDGSTWRELSYEGTTGWVNSRFLSIGSKSSEWSEDEKLSCSGTEPFWSYEIAGDKAALNDPGADGESLVSFSVKARQPGIGRRGLWFVYAESDDKSQGLSAIINRSGQCSDGMSDYLYDLEIFLMGFIPGEGPVQGCCTIQAK